jgi:hypothetical protein
VQALQRTVQHLQLDLEFQLQKKQGSEEERYQKKIWGRNAAGFRIPPKEAGFR